MTLQVGTSCGHACVGPARPRIQAPLVCWGHCSASASQTQAWPGAGSRVCLPCERIPNGGALQRDWLLGLGLRVGVGLPPMLLPPHHPCPTPQNNQLEKIYPEELSRLQRLETLNLQNNRLTSRGEGTPRAWDGATRVGIGCPREKPHPAVPGMWHKAGLGWAGGGSWALTKSHPWVSLRPGSWHRGEAPETFLVDCSVHGRPLESKL